jgi:hypothetical protein
MDRHDLLAEVLLGFGIKHGQRDCGARTNFIYEITRDLSLEHVYRTGDLPVANTFGMSGIMSTETGGMPGCRVRTRGP